MGCRNHEEKAQTELKRSISYNCREDVNTIELDCGCGWWWIVHWWWYDHFHCRLREGFHHAKRLKSSGTVGDVPKGAVVYSSYGAIFYEPASTENQSLTRVLKLFSCERKCTSCWLFVTSFRRRAHFNFSCRFLTVTQFCVYSGDCFKHTMTTRQLLDI